MESRVQNPEGVSGTYQRLGHFRTSQASKNVGVATITQDEEVVSSSLTELIYVSDPDLLQPHVKLQT